MTQALLNHPDIKGLKKTIDIAPLVMGLSYFHPLSPAIIAYLQKHTIAVTIRKKKLLLKAGQMCDYVYFITKGAVRGYIKEGSKDITTWISVENELVTSISSLDIKAPSIENMQAIEDCEMLALSYIDLENLYAKYIDANIAEEGYCKNIIVMLKEGHLLHALPRRKISTITFWKTILIYPTVYRLNTSLPF